MILDPEVQLWNEKLKRLRENEKKQPITISIVAGNYDTEIIIDLIDQAIQDFRVKYQESSIGFENLTYLHSIENEGNNYKNSNYKKLRRNKKIVRIFIVIKQIFHSNLIIICLTIKLFRILNL